MHHALPEFRSDFKAMLMKLNRGGKVKHQSTQAWTPEKLRSLLHDELAGDEVLVVSNREPYIHEQSEAGTR